MVAYEAVAVPVHKKDSALCRPCWAVGRWAVGGLGKGEAVLRGARWAMHGQGRLGRSTCGA